MIRLWVHFSHKQEHPFILQKKADATLANKIRIERVAYINLRIALISSAATKITQLKENTVELAISFGACWVKKNEKWAKYLV